MRVRKPLVEQPISNEVVGASVESRRSYEQLRIALERFRFTPRQCNTACSTWERASRSHEAQEAQRRLPHLLNLARRHRPSDRFRARSTAELS